MNLTLAELATLPLPAALLQGDDVVARTPEWWGAGPGAVSYPLRNGRLVVGGAPAQAACIPVLDRLLDEVDGLARRLTPPQALRVTMLAASLGLLAGRLPAQRGSAAEVVGFAAAGIMARTGLRLTTSGQTRAAVRAPAVAALVLVQLATNAEQHDGATAIDLEVDGAVFTLRWRPAPDAPSRRGRVAGRAITAPTLTARRREARPRWGLGFARIAADAIGGALFPPVTGAGASAEAVLELGLTRLALPMCAVRDGRVLKATRSWDEETGGVPATAVKPGSRLAGCVAAAQAAEGTIAMVEGWCARTAGAVTWVVVPPDGIVERSRDVLDGMVHERALWDGVPDAARVRMVALAAVLGAQLGMPLPRVPGLAWTRAAPAVAAALKLRLAPPPWAGIGAVDPQVALFVAAEIGERFEADGDELWLRVRQDCVDHPLARALLAPGECLWRLS